MCFGGNFGSTFCGGAVVTTLGQHFGGCFGDNFGSTFLWVLWWQLWLNILWGAMVTTLGQHSVGVAVATTLGQHLWGGVVVTTLRQHFGVCCGDNFRSTFCGGALVTTLGQLFCGVLW